MKLASKTCERLNKSFGKVPDKEIYYWFLLLGRALLKDGGELSYIIPNTIMFNVFAREFRLSLLADWDVLEFADCTDYPIFSDATVRNVIISLSKSNCADDVPYRDISTA
ncbi:hypothetical protein NO135_20450, partial [Clostridioides difficile]|nr:hypothetical protein [Clostridioides difficile]